MPPDLSNNFQKSLQATYDLLKGVPTRKEFEDGFKRVLEFVGTLKTHNAEELKGIRDEFQGLTARLKGTTDADLVRLQADSQAVLQRLRKEQQQGMNFIRDKVRGLKNGKDGASGATGAPGQPGEDGSPDNAYQVRDKLETLEGDERLDASAIRNLPEATVNQTVTRVGWGAHPLTIQGLGITIDKNTRFINFKGTGLTSVTRRKDGVVEVTIGGGGGTGTLVSEEVPTDSGDHLSFTLAHTPDAGTLRVYRGGARQQSIGATPDFSLSGATITLVTALDVINGEVLMADYAYT